MSERRIALLIGLGQTGAASARWLVRQNYWVRLLDTRSSPTGLSELLEELGAAVQTVHLGDQPVPDTLFEGVDVVVPSPGMSIVSAPMVEWLARAQQAGAEVAGEVELFAQALQGLAQAQNYHPKLIGVTGTNGKTTVTALTRQMIAQSGQTVCAAGNISPSVLEALMHALDTNSLPNYWVLELSSFQMMTIRSLKLEAGVVLNISPDHLDWHGGLPGYVEAKSRLLSMSAQKIINREDPEVVPMVASLDATDVCSFGADEPVLSGDLGLMADQGLVWLAASEDDAQFGADEPVRRRGKVVEATSRQPGRLQRLMPAQALQLVGQHNVMNVLAAALLAQAVGIDRSPVLHAAGAYAGEPHRMQFVRTIQGVDFIDDSKGTNVGATVAGLEGLTQSAVLIAGGVTKGQDFTALAQVVADKAIPVVLIGQDVQQLQDALHQKNVQTMHASSMQDAVEKAFSWAQAGQAVVLSPACSSFDMFRDYVHRAMVYVDAVQEFALDQGEVA